MVAARESRSAPGPVRESLAARRRRRARRALVAYVVAAATIYAGAWHVAHHPTFAIQRVEVEGNVVTSDEGVAAAARAALASPSLSLLPMSNAYLTRDGRVEDAVEAALPEVATATVQRRGQTLEVRVAERARFGYWCRPREETGQVINGRTSVNDLPGSDGGEAECFAVDSGGLIFAPENPAAGATIFSGLVAAADPIRARYAPGEPWANLRAVVEGTRARGYSPVDVATEDGIDFTVQLAEGPRLIVDAEHSGAQALENLQIALDDESLSSLALYEHVDLRLPHKVFLRAAGQPAE